jgi:hypothetical protein
MFSVHFHVKDLNLTTASPFDYKKIRIEQCLKSKYDGRACFCAGPVAPGPGEGGRNRQMPASRLPMTE